MILLCKKGAHGVSARREKVCMPLRSKDLNVFRQDNHEFVTDWLVTSCLMKLHDRRSSLCDALQCRHIFKSSVPTNRSVNTNMPPACEHQMFSFYKQHYRCEQRLLTYSPLVASYLKIST